MSKLKDWEIKIKADIKKGNTYTVVSNGQRWLCRLIKGDYFACDGLVTKLTNVSNIIKI